MPLKVEGHTVLYLKAPFCGKLMSRGLRNDSIFSQCRELAKSVYLPRKVGLGRFVSLSTVHTYRSKSFLDGNKERNRI